MSYFQTTRKDAKTKLISGRYNNCKIVSFRLETKFDVNGPDLKNLMVHKLSY